MEIGIICVGVFYGVFQIVFLACMGAILSRLGALDPLGSRKVTLATYYIFLPAYCAIGIAKELDLTKDLNCVGYPILSYTLACIFSAGFAWIYCKFANIDIRSISSFVIITTFGSITAFPVLMAKALCDSGGPLEGQPQCKYVQGYAVVGILIISLYIWTICPLFLYKEAAECYNIRRKICVIREIYGSMQEFMNDKNLDSTEKSNNQLELFINPPLLQENSSKTNTDLIKIDSQDLVEFSLQISLNFQSDLDSFNSKFTNLISHLDSQKFQSISQKLPAPTIPPEITPCYILYQLVSPPVVATIIGFIISAIIPLKEAISHNITDQVFMKTLTTVSNIAVPNLVMVLGAKLYGGFSFGKDANLRVKDLIACCILRLLIIPLIGIGFINILSVLDKETFENNKVLKFIVFSFWNVPPSTQLVSVFVVVQFYLKEMAIMQFWTNVLSTISMAVFYIIYFAFSS